MFLIPEEPSVPDLPHPIPGADSRQLGSLPSEQSPGMGFKGKIGMGGKRFEAGKEGFRLGIREKFRPGRVRRGWNGFPMEILGFPTSTSPEVFEAGSEKPGIMGGGGNGMGVKVPSSQTIPGFSEELF